MSMLCMKELKVIISKDPYRYRLLNSVCKTLRWLMWRLKHWLSFLCAGFIRIITRNMIDLRRNLIRQGQSIIIIQYCLETTFSGVFPTSSSPQEIWGPVLS